MLGENPGPGTKFAKAWDFHSSFEAALYVLVCLALVLGISHISHFYFERPVSNWLRRRK
jgi:peptidoglycan/LPS O-acetylase OafA/YrhL